MIRKYLALCLLICVTLQACDMGCLKCDKANQCVICDIRSNYFLLDGTCLKLSIPNCAIYIQTGDCLQCNQGYYLDLNTNSCIPLSEYFIINGCKLYDSSKRCVRCQEGFYISGASCTSIAVAVTNCDYYLSNGSCAKCKSGYIFSADRLSCVSKPTSYASCVGFSPVQCVQCADGYYQNINLYISSFYKQNINTLLLSTSEIFDFGSLSEWTSTPICQKVADENCLVANSLTTCQTCKSGYFVNPLGNCEFILSSLPNCITKQTTNNDCILCQSGFYTGTVSNRNCKPRANFTCLTYDPNNDACLTCAVTKYLDYNKICQARTFNNCLTYTLTEDNCLTCAVTHYLNVNKLCQARTFNSCLTYNPTADYCLTCDLPNYWKNGSNLCIARTVLNCLDYDSAVDRCLTCSSGRYLTNGNCNLNTASNCLTKSTVANLCTACISTAYLDLADNLCKLYTATFCTAYNPNANACTQCPADYYLNGTNCSPNTSINCSAKSSTANTCTTCVGNTYRDAGNVCQPYTVSFCDVWSSNSNACTTCLTGYYKSSNTCVINDSTNCSVKSQVSNTCTTCNAGYYAQTSHDCALIFVANCKTHHATLNQCVTCNDFYYLVGNNVCTLNPDAVLHCAVYTSATTCGKCSDMYLLASPTSCVAIAENQKILNCATYQNDISTVQCTQCISGYYVNNNVCTARVYASISNCSVINLLADQCLTCATNYRLTDDKAKCLPVITDCKTYAASTVSSTSFTCTACIDGKYVQSGTSCVIGDSTKKCLAFANLTDCLSCVANYYLNGVLCVAHTASVTNCSALSTTGKNECGTCALGYHPFKILYGCKSATVVNNCATYNASATCTSCTSNYYLTAANQCSALPSNCKTANTSGTCTECKSGYILDGTNACFAVFRYISQNCNTLNTNLSYTTGTPQDTTSACSVCNSGTVTHPIGGAYMCIETTLAYNLGISGGNIVSNCKIYSNANPPTCLECKSGFHLSNLKASNPTCVDDSTPCSASQILVLDNLDGKVFGCITPTSNMNCQVATRIQLTGEDPDRFACLQVAATYLPVISLFSLDVSTIAYEYSATNAYGDWKTYPSKVFYQGYSIDSILNSGTNVLHTTGTCELYFETSGYYVCYRASFGNSVNSSGSGSTASSTTVPIADCDTAVTYTGYPSYLSAVLSCHACTTSTNAVFVNIQLNGDSSSYWAGLPVETSSVICSEPTTTVANCAVYGNLFDNTNQMISVCLACLPGYKPSAANANKSVASCTAITNCDLTAANNKIANRCQQCLATNGSGQPLAFLASDMTSCVATTTSNCFLTASTLNASNVYDCVRCQAGYSLNPDKKCVALSLVGCSDASSTIFGSVTSSNLLEYHILKARAGKEMKGCNACTTATDYIVQMNSSEKQCVTSSYVSDNSYVASTVYISNCSLYMNYYTNSGSTAFKCSACLAGYILTTDNLKCVTTITNCSMASPTTNTKCAVCTTNFVSVNGVCQSLGISNCSVYADTSNGTSQICSQCIDGYSKMSSGASCTSGSVANCKTYTDGSLTDCTVCLSGYGFITLANNAKMCVDLLSSTTKCLDANSVSLNSSNLQCTKCFYDSSSVYAVTQITSFASYPNIALSYCFPHPTKTNCASYDGDNLSMSANTFNCLTCNSASLFVRTSDYTCVTRTTRANCSTYTSGADTCATCAANYWVSADGNTCNAYPVSILNCRVYSDATTCTSCEPNYYLSGNVCLAVTNIVANCLTYSSATVCSACQPLYLLNSGSNVCDKITASNCLTYTNYYQCATCSTGYKVKAGTGSIIDCVVVDLQYCSVQTGSWPYCSSCTAGYFVNPATSFCAAPTPITGCTTYASYSTCSVCALPYFKDPSNLCVIPNISGCSTYSSYNTCSACSGTNYFPSVNGSSCVLANSVSNCQTYSALTTCQACITNYRLEIGACNLQQTIVDCLSYASSSTCATCVAGKFPFGSLCSVPTSVPNCSFYATSTTCQTCSNGYFLASNKLSCTLIIVVANCATYSSATQCSTCNTGYMLNGNSCPQIVAISGCTTWSAYNTCSACNVGLFLYQNRCTPGEVPNCLSHDSATTCTKCSQGYVLVLSRQVCSPSYATFNDLNCQNSKLIAQASCSLCSPGYYFAADGTCTSCSTNKLSDGCLNCDPSNQSVCFMCKSGYYQTSEGKCLPYSLIDLNPTETSNNQSVQPISSTSSNSTISDNSTTSTASTNSTNNTSSSNATNTTTTTNSTNTTNTTDSSNSTNATNGTATSNTTSNATNNTANQNDKPVKDAFITGAIRFISILAMLVTFAL